MKYVIKKISLSFVLAVMFISLDFVIFKYLQTYNYLSDVGGVGSFVSVFGTLFGILLTLVLVEVWSQFNVTSGLVEKEAIGLEKIFVLSLNFNDEVFSNKLKKVISEYLTLVIDDNFRHVASGQRNKEAGKKFREIAKIIKVVNVDDKRDSIVYDHILEKFNEVFETRALRINMSLTRLPKVLKIFLNIALAFMISIFLFMPFANVLYDMLVIGFLTFITTMAMQIINDLDNPFMGNWVITPEAFKRTLEHLSDE